MLKFVYPASKPGQFDEVHLFDFMSPATYSRLKSQGRSGKLMMRSPPAIPRDHVMDCELLILCPSCSSHRYNSSPFVGTGKRVRDISPSLPRHTPDTFVSQFGTITFTPRRHPQPNTDYDVLLLYRTAVRFVVFIAWTKCLCPLCGKLRCRNDLKPVSDEQQRIEINVGEGVLVRTL